jgi:hypothetical protein
MAIFESNSNTVIVKVTAQELKEGKKILVVILNNDNLKIESEISSNFRIGVHKKNELLANSGDAWISVGSWN